MNTQRHTVVIAAITLLLVGGLGACGDANKTAGQKLDDATATSQRKAAEAKADVKQAAGDVKDTAGQALDTAKQAARDASITTAINAKLVQDSSLSTFKIDVDTRGGGQVALSGTAPDAAAKARATQLAQGVEGVRSVDNRLAIR